MFKTLCNILPSSKSSTQQYPLKSCFLLWLLNLCVRAHIHPSYPPVSSKTPEVGHMTSLTIPHHRQRFPVNCYEWYRMGEERLYHSPSSYLDQVTTMTIGLFYCTRIKLIFKFFHYKQQTLWEVISQILLFLVKDKISPVHGYVSSHKDFAWSLSLISWKVCSRG